MSKISVKTDKIEQKIFRADYQPPVWLVPITDMLFELAVASIDGKNIAGENTQGQNTETYTQVTTKLVLQRNAVATQNGDPKAALILDCKEIPKLCSIAIDGQVLTEDRYSVSSSALTILNVPDNCLLEIVTRIRPESNRSCEGIYQSSGIYCSQMEAEGFRRVTYFPDRPDVLSVFTCTIIGHRDRFPVMLSNGNLTASEDLGDGRQKITYHDPFPKPSYLFALVAGDLGVLEDTYTTLTGRVIQLRIFAAHRNVPRLEFAMRCLKRVFLWEEEVNGFEYDLDTFCVVSVSDFNAGAMENKGLNIFNDLLVIGDIRTASDQRLERIDRVLAHEYLHNRTGDRITCQSWFELTLKEGLTVRRDTMYGEAMYSSLLTRIDTVQGIRSRVFAEALGPNKHPIRPESFVAIDNFYSGTVYEGGSEVIRMGQLIIGLDQYYAGMQEYFRLFDGQAVTCEDFWFAMNVVSGYDFSTFFRWYYQGGVLKVKVTDSYDAKSGEYILSFEQDLRDTFSIRGDVLPFEFPIVLGLLNAQGEELPLKLKGENDATLASSKTLICNKLFQSFTFEGVSEKPIPSLFRGFSALLEYDYPYSAEELTFILANDTDGFNQFEAGQRLYREAVSKGLEQLCRGEQVSIAPELLRALGNILSNQNLDPAFMSRLLGVPDLSELGNLWTPVDYEMLHQVREAIITTIATFHQDKLQNMLTKSVEALNIVEDIASSEAMGWRALRNTILSLLQRVANEEVNQLCLDLVRNAKCMSDETPAIGILSRTESAYRDEALRIFAERWESQEDVFLSFFSVRIANASQGVAELVTELANDPRFKAENP